MTSEALGLAGSRRFEPIRHLGSGGMGSVFEAFDHERGTRVALKTLQQPSPSALLYLKNEFRALQDVRHDNLVQLLELVEEDGRFFVAMELVEGCELLPYLRPDHVELGVSGVSETRPVPRGAAAPAASRAGLEPRAAGFDEARLRSALGQLALGLVALHERGKVHRDVKPSNVLVTASGRVVLVDFGLTLDLAADASRHSVQAIGTPAFMAPEQAAGQTITSAADWYSFGVVLYLALTGSLPFRGAEPERQKLRGAPTSASSLNPGAPPDLADLASELLDPDPSRRPDGRSVLARLGLLASQPEPPAVVPFLGREQELGELLAAFTESRQRCVLSLVVGDSGLGKSALAREVLLRVAHTQPNALVLAGRCYERELVPYKAFDGIVDGLSHFLRSLSSDEAERLMPPGAMLLARVFPVLAGLAAAAGETSPTSLEPQAMRSAAFAALRALLTRLAEARPLLLYVDDLQWADTDSHYLLSDLLREPGAPRLHLLATIRPFPDDGAHPVARLCTSLGTAVRRLSLDPLPLEQCRALAQSVLGGSETNEISLAVAREAAGLPLFVQALAQHARERGSAALATLRLEEALLARVEQLAPNARKLLEVVTVAEAPLAAMTASTASALEARDYADSVSLLRVARLVRTSAASDTAERIEPYHDRIRETVLACLALEARRAHHHALADAMQQTTRAGLDALHLVRHLEGAERFAEAAEQAQLAAQRAEQALAFEQASELYRTALRLGRFDPERSQQLRLSLAEALTNAGRGVDAGRAYLELAVGAQPEERLEYRRHAADHLLRSGHLAEGSAVLSEVLREFGKDLGTQRQALMTMLGQRLLLKLRGLSWRERPSAEVSLDVRRRIEAYHAVGVSFALIDTVRGAAFEAQALRLALAVGDPLLLVRTLVMEAGYEGASGARGLAATTKLIAEVDRIIERHPDPYAITIRAMIQGFLDYHAGLFDVAAANLGVVETKFAALPGCYFERAFCQCFGLICLRNAGHWGKVGAGFGGWLREAERRGDRFTEASLRFNLNGVWLARDLPEEALRDLTRVSWIPPDSGYHVQHWYEQQARTEVALYTGDVVGGLARFREQLEALSRSFILRMRLHRCHAQWLLGRLLLASASSRPTRAQERELRVLIRRLHGETLSTAQTWAPLLEAGLEQRLGHAERAKVALELARARAQTHGLVQYARAAELRLGRLLGGGEGAELVRRAEGWAQQQGIHSPERWFASWVPGFD